MPSQLVVDDERKQDPKEQLFDAISSKDLDLVKEVILSNPKAYLNCLDKDELTPLQHACHTGNLELAKFLLDNGAGVDYSKKQDKYTPLMFAAIGSRGDIVRLLLERGCDTTLENCVNRTAAQMAAFVGQSKMVAIINSWVPYEITVEPFTKCRELEDKPRISSPELGKLLHNYIVYPSLHPVRLLLFIKENLDLVKYAINFVYVLENLLSKCVKPPINDECQAVKYHYLAYLLDYCQKSYKTKLSSLQIKDKEPFNSNVCDKCIETIVRRLIKVEAELGRARGCTPQVDHFIIGCIMKFPYPQLNIFRMMTCSINYRSPDGNNQSGFEILSNTLKSPYRMMFQPPEACSVCGEGDKNKRCSKCKSVYYCGPACQRADWFQHKKMCNQVTES